MSDNDGRGPKRKPGESTRAFVERTIRYHQGALHYWRRRFADVIAEEALS